VSRSIQYQQPDANSITEEEERRRRAETAVRGIADGRKGKRSRFNRDTPIGLKTTEAKKKQFDRLHAITTWSYIEIFENALDTFEQWWNANKGAKP
jgi:hypothetical protein